MIPMMIIAMSADSLATVKTVCNLTPSFTLQAFTVAKDTGRNKIKRACMWEM